ncbi:MAG: family 78 glycoside hydrolase catalytic domain [Bacteroidaceae bacterium]
MKRNILLLVAALASLVQNSAAADYRLKGRTEHLDAPLGLDACHPRFTWMPDSTCLAPRQQSWHLVVATDSLSAARMSGRLTTDQYGDNDRVLVVYDGEPLQPRTRYYWRVVTDYGGRTGDSGVLTFETGLGSRAQWFGSWISDGRDQDALPAPYFRRAFSVDKPVRQARVYLAAAGLYELSINGQRVGNHMLDPLYTRFDRRILYVTHDVTAMLRSGGNALGVVLGNGWYNHQSIGVWNFEHAPWRARPAFCLDLVLTYVDGTEQVIGTDYSWRSGTGEVVQNNIYTGEHRDFTRTVKGWDEPDYDDSRWQGIHLRACPAPHVSAQQARPIRIDWERKAVRLTRISDKVWLYDFGQNMAGVTHLRVRGERGNVLHIRHAERLGKDGAIDQSNIDVYYRGDRQRDPFQTDVVTLSGETDDYRTQFNYKGFRYAQVECEQSMELTEDNLTACFLHSDVPQVGSISASQPIIEGLMHASRMSYLSNLMGLPTDCPQREKNGWTGDGHLAIEAGLYNYDGITVYEKWMQDHRDEQQPNGVLPDIIPTGGWGYGTDNGLDWTSTIAIIPWTLYLFYGDTRPLADCYDNIRRYVDYVDHRFPDHLADWGRGDWVPVTMGSNKELTSSVYFYTDARILASAARLLGYHDDAVRYTQLATDIRQAINDKYLNRQTGVYASGTQTEQSVPLYWGVVPQECEALVASRLNERVQAADYHLDVGVLGCKALLCALSQHGYPETAYRVAVQDTYPSWGWWVKNGSTTLLENWRLDAERDISDNHMMFGEIGAWFYKGLAGIYPDEHAPGFHHICLSPYFPPSLERFCARHTSPYGQIESSWTTRGRRVDYTVRIPANSYATLTIPHGFTVQGKPDSIHLSSGIHHITLTRAR